MAKWQYTKGLHDLGNGSWAYLQPDGSWGWSNAGLVVDGDRTLLVDTLFDLKLTREMLATMAHAVPQAAKIDTLVNTHVNGDHTHGNQLVIGAEIVGTRQLREEMEAFPPEQLAALFRNWRALGAAGEFLNETMGSRFDFDGVVNTPPTRLFDGELTLKVGDKEVRLVDLGPAHTPSDTVAYVPQDRTLFTGDLLFHGGHPAVSAGPVRNWIAACDRMLGWDVETVVPGHGPITDKNAARAEGLFRDADRRGTQALRCRAVGRGGRPRHPGPSIHRLDRRRAHLHQCQCPLSRVSRRRGQPGPDRRRGNEDLGHDGPLSQRAKGSRRPRPRALTITRR
jgi:glyoxylase-like metal-dependent hydrolase (beta-lactamase superfamily II)